MNYPSVTLLTLTGGRPEAFKLCEYYMGRQTYQGPLSWLVIDDVAEPTVCTMEQQVLRREPYWQDGQKTLRENFLLGIETIHRVGEVELVLMIEDDDWYHPDYIAYMVQQLEEAEENIYIIGEGYTRYYHVGFRTYRENQNDKHASLCATGFKISFFTNLMGLVGNLTTPFIDLRMFQKFFFASKILNSHYCVGIKGLPGRHGCGHAHHNMLPDTHDPELLTLHAWIGIEDAERYAQYYDPEGK